MMLRILAFELLEDSPEFPACDAPDTGISSLSGLTVPEFLACDVPDTGI